MKLVLKSYSSDVDILVPGKSKFYLVFSDEDSGAEVRLPVQQETVIEFVAKTEALKRGIKTKVPLELDQEAFLRPERGVTHEEPEQSEPNEEVPDGATVFGDLEEGEHLEAVPPQPPRPRGGVQVRRPAPAPAADEPEDADGVSSL